MPNLNLTPPTNAPLLTRICITFRTMSSEIFARISISPEYLQGLWSLAKGSRVIISFHESANLSRFTIVLEKRFFWEGLYSSRLRMTVNIILCAVENSVDCITRCSSSRRAKCSPLLPPAGCSHSTWPANQHLKGEKMTSKTRSRGEKLQGRGSDFGKFRVAKGERNRKWNRFALQEFVQAILGDG